MNDASDIIWAMETRLRNRRIRVIRTRGGEIVLHFRRLIDRKERQISETIVKLSGEAAIRTADMLILCHDEAGMPLGKPGQNHSYDRAKVYDKALQSFTKVTDDVANLWDVTQEQILSRLRTRQVADARTAAIYVLWKYNQLAPAKLAKLFRRTEGCINHNLRKAQGLLTSDKVFQQAMEKIFIG
jgi:hypothetical protein